MLHYFFIFFRDFDFFLFYEAFVPRNEFFERWHDYDENGKYIQTALLIWREKVCGFDENLIFRMK